MSEDSNNVSTTHGAGGPPNRPLPPTPDDDDQQGDRTLIMKRVSNRHHIISVEIECVSNVVSDFICSTILFKLIVHVSDGYLFQKFLSHHFM